jgi:hypothetical protein
MQGERLSAGEDVGRRERPRRGAASARGSATGPGGRSVVLQARVDERFARALLDHDAAILGLDGASALVREGLRLVHERAREVEMVAAYDEFYGGARAPRPVGVAPGDHD